MPFTNDKPRIHFEDRGAGEPALVFLHYWGGSSRTWRHVIDRLDNQFRTVALDQRGWGQSDASEKGYALADMADDAERLIASLGLSRYVLVGHSMGGKVAQLIASRHPAGLVGLVLVASAPPTPLALEGPARDMMATAYDTRESVEATIDHVLTASTLGQTDRQQIITDSLGGAAQAKRAWPAQSSGEDITAATQAINVPVAVVSGEGDRVDTVDTVRAKLLPHLKHHRFTVLSGVGHLLPLEAPTEIAGLIAAFVASVK
ncbi:alpha/beta hydrolase [Sphingomonas sanguinis]|uniref:alpha/beta fold hydrolase n=1 Tax=Sphingomonas sanguinis TaxID=33051 RepID=UPI001C594A62|nr:alpha/beta hydrolase [Sphingomonas sanguinis]QXT34887.1 alpha/beta hydrolase [Sphingomonas sanguinis]